MEQYAHAFLLWGGSEESREQYACDLIKRIIESDRPGSVDERLSRRIDNGSYSDILWVRPEKTVIPIDAIRGIREFALFRPAEGNMKFVVISDCTKMKTETQNAMLKTLEETPAGRVIILLSPSTDGILPTVLSRLQQIKLTDEFTEAPSGASEEELLKLVTVLLLEGDLDRLWEASAMVASDRSGGADLLTGLYGIFENMYTNRSGAGDLRFPAARQLSENMSAPLCDRVCEMIKQTISDIKGNANMNMACEALFIRIREAYNAENSRY